MPGDRYKVVAGSSSQHCCFDYTIVDTGNLDGFGFPESICECFEVEDATLVAAALNYHSITRAAENPLNKG